MTPPQSAVTIVSSQPLEPVSELLRVRCDGCGHQVGMEGRREHMQSLLERAGWRLGATMLCPDCVKRRGRQELARLTPTDFQHSTSDLEP